jgi:hypothetical protein
MEGSLNPDHQAQLIQDQAAAVAAILGLQVQAQQEL